MVFDAQFGSEPSLVGPDGGFILAVGANREGGFCKDAFEGLLVIDQEISGTRPYEDLDSWNAGSPFEVFEIGR